MSGGVTVDTPLLRAVRMRREDGDERKATPLELLFDLCFVVAVALLAAELHHAVTDGHAVDGALRFALLFVPLWWAWMSHTWFATAFDNDDAVLRLLTLVQMGGVLAVAATIPEAFAGDLTAFAIAYTVTRLPLVGQWLRAARDDHAYRRFALRYATGTAVALPLWLSAAVLPGPAGVAVWALALAVDLGTPPLAVRVAPGRVFHAGHIVERYGLFTIIVLGETILAVTTAAREAVDRVELDGAVLTVSATALLLAFALWWVYFDTLGREGLGRNRRAAFTWGYGHYLVFASVAAVGAGVQAQLELLHADVPRTAASAVAVPVAATLGALAWLQHAANGRRSDAGTLLAAAVAAAVVAVAGGWLGPVTANLALAALLAAVVLRLAAGPPATTGRNSGRGPGWLAGWVRAVPRPGGHLRRGERHQRPAGQGGAARGGAPRARPGRGAGRLRLARR